MPEAMACSTITVPSVPHRYMVPNSSNGYRSSRMLRPGSRKCSPPVGNHARGS